MLTWWIDYLTTLDALLGIPKKSREFLKENNVYYLDLTYRKKVA